MKLRENLSSFFFFMSNDVDENFASFNDTKLFELCENIQVIQYYP